MDSCDDDIHLGIALENIGVKTFGNVAEFILIVFFCTMRHKVANEVRE